MRRRFVRLLAAAAGACSRSWRCSAPGLIAANAGNDAGGIATYSSVGARYGYALLWMMVVITVSLIVVQEMAARMGIITGKGLADLVREQYGIRWALFATGCVLVANLGICISEFVGIGAALGLAHVPTYVSVPIGAVAVWLLLVRGTYKFAERIFIVMTIPFFAYPIAAILAHPDWGAVGNSIVVPRVQLTAPYLLLFVAVAGHDDHAVHAAVPAVVRGRTGPRSGPAEPGARRGRHRIDLRQRRRGLHHHRDRRDAVPPRRPLGQLGHRGGQGAAPFAGRFAEVLFAVGLLGASLLAAAVLPVTAAYVISETFGFERGVSRSPREAPVFVGVVTALVIIGAVVAMIPGIPVFSLLVGVQVVNGVLLPVTLFFVWRLSASREVMGGHRNGRIFNVLAGATVVVTSGLSLALLVVTILGL